MSGAIAMVRAAVLYSRGEHDDDLEREINRLADGVSTDRLSRTELQLLPVLASSFIDLVPDHPATPIAEGAKRRAAAEALLSQSAATSAASALADHGLTVAPLKGLALSGTYEALTWRRPMGDADLLIINETTWDVITKAMVDAGFNEGPWSFHARNFDRPDGRRVDVHRFISTPNSFPAAIAPVKSHLTNMNAGAGLAELEPEFHMAHAIEHAMRWNPIPPARSISDIAALQMANPDMDWSSVYELLHLWCAANNARALTTRLVSAQLLPVESIDTTARPSTRTDRWLEYRSPMNARTSSVNRSLLYLGLVPWRLRVNGAAFSYPEYLRILWELDEGDSVWADIGQRFWRRVTNQRRSDEDQNQ